MDDELGFMDRVTVRLKDKVMYRIRVRISVVLSNPIASSWLLVPGLLLLLDIRAVRWPSSRSRSVSRRWLMGLTS